VENNRRYLSRFLNEIMSTIPERHTFVFDLENAAHCFSNAKIDGILWYSPHEKSSGRKPRHENYNRDQYQLNYIFHCIAISQIE